MLLPRMAVLLSAGAFASALKADDELAHPCRLSHATRHSLSHAAAALAVRGAGCSEIARAAGGVLCPGETGAYLQFTARPRKRTP